MVEQWKQVRGFPKYSVSNFGEIRYDARGRILVPWENQYGVVCVGLMKEGKQHHRSVPKIVATAFIPHRFGAFDTPINLDGDRHNNHVDNLTWRPRWFAVQYNRQFRVPYPHPILSPIQDVQTGKVWSNSFECAKDNGLLEKDVVLSIANRTLVWPTHQQFFVLD
jgi:hypothetical protein